MITTILLILDLYLNSLLITCLPYLIHLFVRVATELHSVNHKCRYSLNQSSFTPRRTTSQIIICKIQKSRFGRHPGGSKAQRLALLHQRRHLDTPPHRTQRPFVKFVYRSELLFRWRLRSRVVYDDYDKGKKSLSAGVFPTR